MRTSVSAAILLVACAACRSVPSNEILAARFDRLMRYVPCGMESLMFIETSGSDRQPSMLPQDQAGAPGSGAGAIVREVYAGRKFQPGGNGIGDFEGVILTQYRDGVPPGWDVKERGELTSVGGRRAVSVTMPWFPAGNWWMQVEPDILLYATRRELLEQSLRMEGAPAANAVAALGWRDRIRWDGSVLVRRFDRTNGKDCYSPFGNEPLGGAPRNFDIDGFVLEISDSATGASTLRIRAHTHDADKTRAWFEHAFYQAPLGEGRFAGDEWSLAAPIGGDGLGLFTGLLLFGCNVIL